MKSINSEITSLEDYSRTVQQTLSELESIENRHKMARNAVNKYDFTDAAALLGLDSFNQILRKAGVFVE